MLLFNSTFSLAQEVNDSFGAFFCQHYLNDLPLNIDLLELMDILAEVKYNKNITIAYQFVSFNRGCRYENNLLTICLCHVFYVDMAYCVSL